MKSLSLWGIPLSNSLADVVEADIQEQIDEISKDRKLLVHKVNVMTGTGKPQLIAMMGLPRSGKSTIVKRLMTELGAPVVRRDAIRLALHGERFISESEPMVKAMSVYMIRSLFIAGHPTVICD